MDTFTQKVTEIVERCIPEQTRYINHKHLRREPWLTLSLKHSIEKNKRLYNKSLKCPSRRIAYKTYNSTLRKIIRRAKSTFYKDKCKEFKMQTKKLWRLINEIAGKKNDKSNLIEYLKVGGIQTYNATKISNSFAKYFSEVGKKFADKIPVSSKSITDYLRMMGNHMKSIFLLPTEENEIRKIAFELPTKSSSGYDNISNVLLKEIIGDIVEPLSFIFNHSMQSGEFPDNMKLAEVIPLYKSKEHYLECNYRPISLLTTISKILKKIMYKRVYDFLVEKLSTV